MSPFVVLFLTLHQISVAPSLSGAASGDWQQRVHLRIVASLDEKAATVRAAGDLLYVNSSPDTLREMYFHQYLNAFRPGSRWSAADEREGRVRFQALREPHYAYERFTSRPTFGDTPVEPEYPYAPDSTVVRFALPRPLAPGDSLRARFAWDARPSTLPRRQGRRGRHYDLAQWYPKVAVYDQGGWQQNPLVPAGEFYGEFGTYDVTLIVREDQVIGATGVPVEGDPGWARVKRWGQVHLMADAYGDVGTDSLELRSGYGCSCPSDDTRGCLPVQAPAGRRDASPSTCLSGYKRVRFVAKDVHHFAWSASPGYIYEGGLYDGRVAIHVLYRRGDEQQWGKGQAVERTAGALLWLETIYGRYPYPQVTNLHRIEGGGTEFPMVMMNGSASQGLILHELGHIFTYGILANNEWRSGWMDEGLTSYQTSWAQGFTLHERARGEGSPPPAPLGGYRGLALVPPPHELGQMDQYRLDLLGRAEPIGTIAHEFSEFAIYNAMIYSRAEQMYGALRDVMGDSAFVAFLRLYYDRWKFKHVDEAAIRAAAEAAYGKDLDWFFEQWVRSTGLIDYALRDVEITREGDRWLTRARIERVGEYSHPMPVGARTAKRWTIARGEALAEDQWVEIRTAARPSEVQLDPLHVTEDWDRRNDVLATLPLLDGRTTRFALDWPFLEQSDRNRNVVALTPLVWYSTPGGVNLAARARTNYQGWVDKREFGLAVALRVPDRDRFPADDVLPDGNIAGGSGSSALSRVQLWATVENPRLPGAARPLIGASAGAWLLDGVAKLQIRHTRELSRFLFAVAPQVSRTISLTATLPYDRNWLDADRWEDVKVVDLGLELARRPGDPSGLLLGGSVNVGVRGGDDAGTKLVSLVELEAGKSLPLDTLGRTAVRLRGFLGFSENAPLQRSIGASSLDPTETFANHLLRPHGGLLTRDDFHFVPPGGAGLRGYSPLLRVPDVAAANLELLRAVFVPRGQTPLPQVWISAFADIGVAHEGFEDALTLADVGVGVSLRSQIFDREVLLRADFPLYVREPALAVGEDDLDADRVKFRWSFSFSEPW